MEGSVDRYCCAGCEMAAAIIRDAGLERYYLEREEPAPRPEPGGPEWTGVPVAEAPDGTCIVRLAVDGLRCASCVWVTEGVLTRARPESRRPPFRTRRAGRRCASTHRGSRSVRSRDESSHSATAPDPWEARRGPIGRFWSSSASPPSRR